jgi:putative ABC transport system ATP-binding protein
MSSATTAPDPVAAPGAAVHTAGLTRTFGSGSATVHALRGIDLDIPAGQLVVLAGRSGSGKTTLLNCLSGLDRPDAGTVHLDGHELTAMTDDELLTLRRDRIGFVFQTFGLVPILTARENVGLPLRLRRTRVAEREARVDLLLDLVGLSSQGEQRPSELSGGQQQRVAIARALAADPELLIADEPTGQLDSRTGREIMDLLQAVVADRGTTALIASHDPQLIERADRAIQLRDGRIQT